MATVTIPSEERTLTEPNEIAAFLETHGIWYRSFDGNVGELDGLSNEEILEAFSEPIETLKAEGGYVTADVINITADTPNLDTMLAKFDKEHWHDEDEVRFIADGRGLFHINPGDKPVFRIEVTKGDMINVPRETLHWFHLCSDQRIKAIRLFKDMAGWTPRYSESGTDQGFAPLCFGPSDVPLGSDGHSAF